MIGAGNRLEDMDPRSALVVAALVVALSGTVVALGGVATGAGDVPRAAQADTSGGNESAATGAHVSGAVGVEQVAVDGAVERARLERDLRATDTDRERATTLAAYLDESQARTRLDALERRKARLDDARGNGSMSAGEHDARTARLGAEAEQLHRLADAVANASAALPADLRREHDIESSALRRVADAAGELAARTRGGSGRDGPAVFGDIARMIDAYNARVAGNDADVLERQLRGERVNLHATTAGGSRTVVSFRIAEDGRFTGVRAGPRRDATLRMETDRRTVRQVATDDDAATAFRRAVRENEVRIDGLGALNGLKWTVVDLVSSVLDEQ